MSETNKPQLASRDREYYKPSSDSIQTRPNAAPSWRHTHDSSNIFYAAKAFWDHQIRHESAENQMREQASLRETTSLGQITSLKKSTHTPESQSNDDKLKTNFELLMSAAKSYETLAHGDWSPRCKLSLLKRPESASSKKTINKKSANIKVTKDNTGLLLIHPKTNLEQMELHAGGLPSTDNNNTKSKVMPYEKEIHQKLKRRSLGEH